MDGFLKYDSLPQSSRDENEMSTGKSSSTIKIGEELDKLFPTKSATKDGELVTIQVSRKQPTLFEIHSLTDHLDNMVKKFETEQAGFSNKLRDIYEKLFDELIRQEMIACLERGLMFVAIKKEALNVFDSMQKLYRSSYAYAIAKDLLTKKDIIQMRIEIPKFMQQIDTENEALQKMHKEWQERKKAAEEAENIRLIKQTFMENQLILSNQQIVNQIEDIIDTEHKWLKDLD